MARIYQNEKVLMREVGLIKTSTYTVIKKEVTTFEGTHAECLAHAKKLNAQPNVVVVIGEYK
jgi:hypothetical protein